MVFFLFFCMSALIVLVGSYIGCVRIITLFQVSFPSSKSCDINWREGSCKHRAKSPTDRKLSKDWIALGNFKHTTAVYSNPFLFQEPTY